MATILERLGGIDEELAAERRDELRRLGDALHSAIMNIPCDLSATPPEHHTGHGAGHRQARHRAAEIVSEMFAAALEG